jgi:cytochrome c551/c552
MKFKSGFILMVFALPIFNACSSETKSIKDFKSISTEKESEGSILFASKCAMCHSKEKDLIGPSLAGVSARWKENPEKLVAFIKNSQAVIKGGDAYAINLYEKWNRSIMPSFEQLSDQEIADLINYLNDKN